MPNRTNLCVNGFSGLAGRIRLIIAGDRDPYCNAARLLEAAGRIRTPVKLLAGDDHFYIGREKDISDGLEDFWSGQSGSV